LGQNEKYTIFQDLKVFKNTGTLIKFRKLFIFSNFDEYSFYIIFTVARIYQFEYNIG